MLNCSILKEGDVNIVYLEGELDASTSCDLSKILVDFVNEGMHQVILDMGGLTYISSNGLRPLLEWLDATRNVSGKRKMALCGLQEFVNDVFKVTEFNLKFPIYDNADIALCDFNPIV